MEQAPKYFIAIPATTGSKPVYGKKLYGKRHAERLCKKHPGWNAIELTKDNAVSGAT
jgi:hypothetical protein